MKQVLLILVIFLFGITRAQNGYEIKITLKNLPDTTVYLAKYHFGKQYVVDTCHKIKNGVIVFKGNTQLDKGIYFTVNQAKGPLFDFIVNESSKLNFTSDMKDLQMSLHAQGSKENEDFFNYTRYYISKNKEFGELKFKTKGMSKSDSTKFMQDKAKQFTEEVVKFENDLMAAQKGTFFGAWLNLKSEKEAKEIPAQKSAADSAYYKFNYYRTHYFEGVNFSDDRLLCTQFLESKINNYFDNIVQQLGPDSVIADIDRVLKQCPKDGEMFKYLFVHFMVKYENHKLVGFDKVFVHLTDEYVKKGAVKSIYDETTVGKIVEKSDRIKPLLIGNVAPELFLIDTINGKAVRKMGFDTASTSESISKLYTANVQKLAPMFVTLSSIKAKYTVLVFWDVECSHCKVEIPKLIEIYHELIKTTDVKIVSIYTQTDFDKWRKYIIEHKLDFVNVFDPIYINNLKNKYDIFSTPKVYLLDKDKVIISKHMPVEKLPEVIKMQESAVKK